MSSAIDFYFDFSSPYGYFASTRIEALGRDLDREINWRPILLGPLFKITGTAPLIEIPLKGAYSRHDMQRTAQLHDIPFRLPSPFPIATVAAARIMLHVKQSSPEQAIRFAHRALHAYYVDNVNIGETERALDIAGESGLDVDALREAIASDALRARLREENEAAVARGVFGSPFIIIDEEPFWGFDRLDTIRRWAAR
jgi:2-hydroxychromene-2-carboxylate isomerase